MGILDDIFKKTPVDSRTLSGWQTITEQYPYFSAYSGEIYQQELTRAVIERFATACCKLVPTYNPDTMPVDNIKKLVVANPNVRMTWSAFLARVATLYEVDASAFVVPSFKRDMVTIDGFWPLKCDYAEILEYRGEPWVRFTFPTGERWAIELRYVCIISKFQYSSDFFGEPNCLDSTMNLIDAQNQAQDAAIRNGGKIRFIGSLTGQVREEDMKKKRERFVADNFNAENTGGLMLYDQTFQDIRQIEPYSYVMDTAEMERIEKNVYTYFGANEDILQNKYSEDVWGAWYEGKIEPFALKLGEGLTKMVFTDTQVRHGHAIVFSANRLQYASLPSKRNMIRDMLDRGVFTINQAMEILQMEKVPDGDVRIIRGEYVGAEDVSQLLAKLQTVGNRSSGRAPMNEAEKDFDLGGDDQIYKDSDGHNKDDF